MEHAHGCWQKFPAGCWQEASVLLNMDLTTGLLKCSNDAVAGLKGVTWERESKENMAVSVFYEKDHLFRHILSIPGSESLSHDNTREKSPPFAVGLSRNL